MVIKREIPESFNCADISHSICVNGELLFMMRLVLPDDGGDTLASGEQRICM